MNELFLTLGIESWKPLVGVLLLPPLPMLLLVLVGARLMFRRRLLAWFLILLGVVSLWLACTGAVSGMLTRVLTRPPPALTEAQVLSLKGQAKTAIVVLGGGSRSYAPEYGMSSLLPRTMERLRYGLWLSRATGLPVAMSGGVGHGAREGPGEAEIGARIAEREFGRPLRWIESASRDTRENAQRTVAMLRADGIQRIVLVTHDFHMRRAVLNFEKAAGAAMEIVPAPMDLPQSGSLSWHDWLPNASRLQDTVFALREWIGRLAGA
ncbi:YdcF family protein [Rubrivivax rivuli]|uniref:YdcF family protein n=1 Tax=Rubrivivax rivuli TaxID=1862385 RepID=A0A437RJZ1_9BURK|nr:YdcF family protein [Rubrivivax rivuli]RVU47104.1 YdcF family protein [Rubrivivax rivuli]